MEGKVLRVLCDGISKNNEDVYSGRTEGGKIVFFEGQPTDKGKFLKIEIERGDTFALYGKITER
jgi:tRNA-2-methylthio-N6-dimethylallyladenosine synthase